MVVIFRQALIAVALIIQGGRFATSKAACDGLIKPFGAPVTAGQGVSIISRIISGTVHVSGLVESGAFTCGLRRFQRRLRETRPLSLGFTFPVNRRPRI